MKIWTSYHTFDHPWDTVTKAVCRKYPNPLNPAVLGTDVIDRQVINGVLHSHRLITSTWAFPTFVRPSLGPSTICYASERSEINPKSKEMVVKTKNVSFCKYIAVGETLRYIPDPNDSQKTLLVQEAIVVIRGVPLISYMEDLLTSKIAHNATKGRQAIDWVIERIDDITIKTKRSMDDLQNVAKKSIDEIQSLTVPPTPQSMPKL